MIRNEKEYREAVERLTIEKSHIDQQKAELQNMGLGPEEIKRATEPVVSFHLQLQEEVESYERLKRGEFGELKNLRGLGHYLVMFRIARNLTQRELAERLGVHESQVSRDERNDYHGITLDRATRILDALEAKLHTTGEIPMDRELMVV